MPAEASGPQDATACPSERDERTDGVGHEACYGAPVGAAVRLGRRVGHRHDGLPRLRRRLLDLKRERVAPRAGRQGADDDHGVGPRPEVDDERAVRRSGGLPIPTGAPVRLVVDPGRQLRLQAATPVEDHRVDVTVGGAPRPAEQVVLIGQDLDERRPARAHRLARRHDHRRDVDDPVVRGAVHGGDGDPAALRQRAGEEELRRVVERCGHVLGGRHHEGSVPGEHPAGRARRPLCARGGRRRRRR